MKSCCAVCVSYSICPANVKRCTRKLQRGGGAGVGIGEGDGSISDGELTSLAATQQVSLARSRLHHHHPPHLLLHRQQQQQQQPGQRAVRLRDAGSGYPGQRRVMHAIRESPEISNSPADTR